MTSNLPSLVRKNRIFDFYWKALTKSLPLAISELFLATCSWRRIGLLGQDVKASDALRLAGISVQSAKFLDFLARSAMLLVYPVKGWIYNLCRQADKLSNAGLA